MKDGKGKHAFKNSTTRDGKPLYSLPIKGFSPSLVHVNERANLVDTSYVIKPPGYAPPTLCYPPWSLAPMWLPRL